MRASKVYPVRPRPLEPPFALNVTPPPVLKVRVEGWVRSKVEGEVESGGGCREVEGRVGKWRWGSGLKRLYIGRLGGWVEV